MKAKTSTPPNTKRLNTVEVEFYCLDNSRTRRKIAIPHGQFAPPLVMHNHCQNQWFMWCTNLGIYQEVTGAVLSSVEVVNEGAN